MTERTPGPWHSRRANSPSDGEYDYAIHITIDGHNYVIAECFGICADGMKLPAEANSSFILRACAAHDDLVTALRDLLIETEVLGADPHFNKTNRAISNARIILKKATAP